MLSKVKNAMNRPGVNGIGGIGGIALLLCAGLVLTGCGSSSTSALNAAAAASSAASAISAAAASGAAGASGADAGASAATSASASSTVKLTGNSNSTFCIEAAAEQAQEDKASSALVGDSPADLQKYEEQAVAELSAFASKAPAQIKSAVQTLVAAYQTFFNALKAANFDYTKLDPSAVASIETPAVQAATDTVTTYLKQVCGIDATATSS